MFGGILQTFNSPNYAGNLGGTISGRESELGVIHVELSFKLKYTRIAPIQKKNLESSTHTQTHCQSPGQEWNEGRACYSS